MGLGGGRTAWLAMIGAAAGMAGWIAQALRATPQSAQCEVLRAAGDLFSVASGLQHVLPGRVAQHGPLGQGCGGLPRR